MKGMRFLSVLPAAAAARRLAARLSGRAHAFQRSITVGVPMETKTLEARVGLTPSATKSFIQQGHRVLVEANAGAGSGFRDEQYLDAGCEIVTSASDVYGQSDMIVKVKEPLPNEYKMVRENQVVFTYFHFASSPELTDAMVKSNAVCIAYETVEKADRSLPLLVPMSEIAGRMATQEGAKYLEKPMGGRGVLLGGVPGTARGNVLVLGCGVVGTEAAKMAAGLGANVTIMDVNLDRLRYLDTVMPANVSTRFSTAANIEELLPEADLVIGAVLIAGARAPTLIQKRHLKTMKPGSVLVDVAVDQGGCIETCRPTTHDKPTFVVDGVLHYCVANMPGAVPFTSTVALGNATLPYALQLANDGWVTAATRNAALRKGLNIVKGTVVHPAVHADYPLYPHMQVDDMLQLVAGSTPVKCVEGRGLNDNTNSVRIDTDTLGKRQLTNAN